MSTQSEFRFTGEAEQLPLSEEPEAPGPDEEDEEEPEYVFDELEDLADRVFDTWLGGGDRKWAEFAWSVLKEAGYLEWEYEVDRAENVLKLAALASLYREFCAYAFGEGSFGGWRDRLTPYIGDYPAVHPYILGRLVERDGIAAWDEDIVEGNYWDTIADIVTSYKDVVLEGLLEALGPNELFASLWVSRDADMSYPIPDDAYDILNHPEGDAGFAHMWLTTNNALL